MDEVDCSLPTGGSVSFAGEGTDVSAKAGVLAHTGVLILPICRSMVITFTHLWP
jgi:hypothetical protein